MAVRRTSIRSLAGLVAAASLGAARAVFTTSSPAACQRLRAPTAVCQISRFRYARVVRNPSSGKSWRIPRRADAAAGWEDELSGVVERTGRSTGCIGLLLVVALGGA